MMIGSEFIDGPARGATLMLARAPQFLRAVYSELAGWDALDDIEDKPKRTERVIVYRRVGEVTYGFIDYATGNGRRGHCFAVATYEVLHRQPPSGAVRDNLAWRQWCIEHASEQATQTVGR